MLNFLVLIPMAASLHCHCISRSHKHKSIYACVASVCKLKANSHRLTNTIANTLLIQAGEEIPSERNNYSHYCRQSLFSNDHLRSFHMGPSSDPYACVVRVRQNHSLHLSTEIQVYRAIFIPTLLYDAEAWVLYCRQMRLDLR